MSLPRWTREEDKTLEENYSDASPEELQAMLPGRSGPAIGTRARALGLRKSGTAKRNLAGARKGMPIPRWSEKEKSIVALHFAGTPMPELMAMLPGRTENAIRHLASRMGLERADQARHDTASASGYRTWNGFRDDVQTATGGYGMVREPGHPRANRFGMVRSAILAWEKANGRPVPDGYVVRHIDGDPANDDPDNLRLGRPGAEKGSHPSDETRARMSASVKAGLADGTRRTRRKDVDMDALLDMRASGATIKQISARFGVCVATCVSRLREAREAGDPRAAKRHPEASES